MKKGKEMYKYRGVPLMPTVARDLIIERFSGKEASIHDIIKEVHEVHEKRGGLATTGKAKSTRVRDGLTRLRNEGLATAVVTSFWRIAEGEVGSGSGSVYLYYFPTYKKRALEQDKYIWECKIGQTKGDPSDRVEQQTGSSTGIPEQPIQALVLKTDYPEALEKALHAMLTVRGRHIENAPGKEWFVTSPTEVEEMYRLLTYFPDIRQES
jgi:hypothetical protein